MRNILTFLLTISCSALKADPHWAQVLIPYWGDDKGFIKRIQKIDGPVGVELQKYDGENDPDYGVNVYLYLYVIDIDDAKSFSLDISCGANTKGRAFGIDNNSINNQFAPLEGASADPIKNNPKPIITKTNNIRWPLTPGAGRQGMWLFSWNPPTERDYIIKVTTPKEEIIRSGRIHGPSC